MLEFVAPGLGRLDALAVDTVCVPVFEDVRPATGVLADVDWRLAGAVSKLLKDGFLRGALGEHLVLGTNAKFPFPRVLILGAGLEGAFSVETYRRWMRELGQLTEGLGAKEVAVELPRAGEGVPLDEALVTAMRVTRRHGTIESTTVFGDVEFVREFGLAYERERRRAASELPPGR